ncbi:MAG: DUF5615 family PIN-like protein [Streptomycetales bacterium]
MRFLVDEMFPPRVAYDLAEHGHDAVHVRDAGLAGASDDAILRHAMDLDRVLVTENAVDIVPLLDVTVAAGGVPPPVVLALKRTLPAAAGAMAHALATRLAKWAREHPDPCRHVHWVG